MFVECLSTKVDTWGFCFSHYQLNRGLCGPCCSCKWILCKQNVTLLCGALCQGRHFTHIATPCVHMWRQGWCRDAQLLHSSWHLRTLTAGLAGMSWCSDKIWKDSYSPSSTCWCRCLLSDWPSGSFLKDRCEVSQDYQSKNDWGTTLAPDQAGITTEQFFTEIRGFLHFTPVQIFETRTLVKTFVCTIALAQLGLAIGFR